jgi:hypothetical protein
LNIAREEQYFMSYPLVLLALLLLTSTASAHVPLIPEGNDNLTSATLIGDPAKSWAAYGMLEPDTPQYYGFYAKQGERISLSLLSSTNSQEKDFQPGMALMGPGIASEGTLPEFVNLPEGYGALAVEGMRSEEAFYEPFGPGSYYQQAKLNISAPESGIYYVAAYSSSSGHYSLVIGYLEEFSFMERIINPLQMISVYKWEGQSLTTVLMPWIVAFMAGAFIVIRSRRRTPYMSAGTMAAFLFIGTSASILSQMIFSLIHASATGQEIAVTLFLALFPALLGVLALRLARGEAGILQRSLLAVIGTITLLIGAGLILGPVLAVAASVLPSRHRLI